MVAPDPDEEDMEAPESQPADNSDPGCTTDGDRIGWTATLSTKAHWVSGTAVIVDACTVEIRDFEYDGQGIDVRVYGAPGTDFTEGWPVSEDLVRSTPYDVETIAATLPQGRTLEELGAVSIWCVDIPVDQGCLVGEGGLLACGSAAERAPLDQGELTTRMESLVRAPRITTCEGDSMSSSEHHARPNVRGERMFWRRRSQESGCGHLVHIRARSR